MMNQIYVGLVFIVCCLQYIESSSPFDAGVDTCPKKWQQYGCYDEATIDQTTMLLSWRSYINWEDYPKYIEKLSCTCAREARKANVAAFALFWWGQCFPVTSQEIGALEADDISDSCYKGDGTYGLCTNTTGVIPCIGDDSAVSIYNMEPVDGGFSDWGSWSTCSTKCGTGSRSRKRECNNPTPALGGDNCEEESQENEQCTTQPCAVDGGYGDWGGWTTCSKSCGGGVHERSHECDNPKPAYNGKPCSGKSIETATCGTIECAVNGGYGTWSNWGTCSVTCGGGLQKRSRSCNSPPPSSGGASCKGPSKDSRVCKEGKCPTNGGYSAWSDWNACSVKCGGGERSRHQKCEYLSICRGNRVQKESCNSNHCPIIGGYSSWSPWSKCSKHCGSGARSRVRFCNNPKPEFGGKHCVGRAKERSTCNNRACPVNGGYSRWSPWSKCSKHCGRGTISRTRSCNNPKSAFGGKHCVGRAKQILRCNKGRCPGVSRWTKWGLWSRCNRKCGRGTQRSYRKCLGKPRPKPRRRKCRRGRKGYRKCLAKNRRRRRKPRRRRRCRGKSMRLRRCNTKCANNLPNCALSHERKYFVKRTSTRRGFTSPHVIARIGKQYQVAFGFIAHKLSTGAILQVKAKRQGKTKLGKRMPLVKLKRNGKGKRGSLIVQLPINGKFNRDVIFHKMIVAGKAYNLNISQRKVGKDYFVTVTLTGAGQRKSFKIKNTRPQYFRKLTVHAIPGWRRRVNASIQNLIISGICTK